jgi:hypothetical protein
MRVIKMKKSLKKIEDTRTTIPIHPRPKNKQSILNTFFSFVIKGEEGL